MSGLALPPSVWISVTEEHGGRVVLSTSTEREHVVVHEAWKILTKRGWTEPGEYVPASELTRLRAALASIAALQTEEPTHGDGLHGLGLWQAAEMARAGLGGGK